MSNSIGSNTDYVRMLQQHDQDLYRGNGKPGLTTRMKEAETCMEAHTRKIDNIQKMFWAIILLLLTILGGVITDIAKGKEESSHSSISTSY